MPIRRDRLFGLIFSDQKGKKLEAAACRIIESDGSTWSVAQWKARDNRLEATLACGAKVTIPIDSIGQMDFSQDKVVYLDSLEPASFEWTPFFGSGEKGSDRQFEKIRRQWFAPHADGQIDFESDSHRRQDF